MKQPPRGEAEAAAAQSSSTPTQQQAANPEAAGGEQPAAAGEAAEAANGDVADAAKQPAKKRRVEKKAKAPVPPVTAAEVCDLIRRHRFSR